MSKTDTVDVDQVELVEEVHERIDVLVELLIEKGVIGEHEYKAKMNEYLEGKYDK